MNEVGCYQVGVRGANWTRDVLALSPGRAKAEYWREVSDAWPDVRYTDITSRRGVRWVDERFDRVAAYRGVDFAKIGMRVEVDGQPGVLVGSNSSANFNVLFTGGKFRGQTLNCHPNWMMRYFDDGKLLKEFGA